MSQPKLSSPSQTTPPIPKFILRGHVTSIQALHFLAQSASSRVILVSGDAAGWIIVWTLATKRALAVWRGHEGGVLGLKGWDDDNRGDDESREGTRAMKLVSHGRDHKLRIWQLPDSIYLTRKSDSSHQHRLSTCLPVDGATSDSNPWPWLLHSFSVNALNYCAFSMCEAALPPTTHNVSTPSNPSPTTPATAEQEPRPQHLKSTNDRPQSATEHSTQSTLLASPNGLDTGGIDIFSLPTGTRISRIPSEKSPQTGMVMALVLFRHPSSSSSSSPQPQTPHHLMLLCGYESGHAIIYTTHSVPPHPNTTDPNSITWHRILIIKPHTQPILSIAISPDKSHLFTSSADAQLTKYPIPSPDTITPLNSDTVSGEDETQRPVKTLNTKHAGQQGLSVRSDERIFATAGWDGMVRVYSCKSLKEVAGLKWHRQGCYAVAFMGVEEGEGVSGGGLGVEGEEGGGSKEVGVVDGRGGNRASSRPLPLERLRIHREMEVRKIHWLAAGGKDGNISLWDIY